jgi:hypothetical protein
MRHSWEIGDYFIRARIGKTPARLTYPGFGTFTEAQKECANRSQSTDWRAIVIPTQATSVVHAEPRSEVIDE